MSKPNVKYTLLTNYGKAYRIALMALLLDDNKHDILTAFLSEEIPNSKTFFQSLEHLKSCDDYKNNNYQKIIFGLNYTLLNLDRYQAQVLWDVFFAAPFEYYLVTNKKIERDSAYYRTKKIGVNNFLSFLKDNQVMPTLCKEVMNKTTAEIYSHAN